VPQPGPGEVRVAISARGVCRTDLHVVDGDIHGDLPILPGHEVVGHIEAMGVGVSGFSLGQRVGVPSLGHTCGHCPYCERGRENLCDDPLFTGFTGRMMPRGRTSRDRSAAPGPEGQQTCRLDP